MPETPTISVQQFKGGSLFILCATSYGRTEVAGPRLFRAAPHPDIEWSHLDEPTAQIHAKRLTDYLVSLPSARKTKKKSTARSAFEE